MRPRGLHRLAVISAALLLLFTHGGKALGQLGLEVKDRDHELTLLLKRLDASKDGSDLVRDGSGKIASLTLRGTEAYDRELYLVSTLDSVKELTIRGRGLGDEWTKEGISHLHKLTNLTSLRLLCVSPHPALKNGVFQEICSLRSLKSLSLVSAYPERSDYLALTNLQKLTELNVAESTNFGDSELCLLTNLPNLRILYISHDAVSREGTNVLSRMPHLTKVTVRP